MRIFCLGAVTALSLLVCSVSTAGSTCGGTTTASTATYGVGKAGILGVPSWQALNNPTLPSAGFQLSLANAAPSSFAMLAAGVAQASIPFDGGTLLVQPQFAAFFLVTNPVGQVNASVVLPANPVLCGNTIFTQMLIQDTSLTSFFQVSMSNGLIIILGD